MPSAEQYSNNYITTLNGAITNAQTTLTLTSATNAPNAPFRVLIDNEIIIVGARSGTAASSLTRGAEGTAAAAHSSGASVVHILTRDGLKSAVRRGSTFVVAASNASAESKLSADWVCDGTADQTEINAAIAAIPTGVGGSVELTEGDFYLSGSVVMNRSGVWLKGRGTGVFPTFGGLDHAAGGTRLRYASGLATAAIAVHRTDASFPVGDVKISDLIVDGANSGTAIDGIMFRAFESIIDSVKVMRMTGHGIRIKGYGPADPNGRWATYDTHIVNCKVYSNSLSGIYSDGYGEDLQIAIITSNNNGEDGFRIEGSSCQIIDSHSYSNSRYGMNLTSGAARVKIVGCKIEHAGQHGVVMAGYQSLISGSNIHINGQTTNATYANIYITASDAVINGCSIGYDTGEGGNRPNYGIQGPSGSSIISGCNLTGVYPGGNVNLSANHKLRACNIADVN